MPNQSKFGGVCSAICIMYFIASCNYPNTLQPTTSIKHLQSFPIAVKRPKGYNKGKRFSDKEWKQVYLKNLPKNVDFPTIDGTLSMALENQLKLLKRRKAKKNYPLVDLEVSVSDLKTTIETLLDIDTKHDISSLLENDLDAYQIRGKDGKGNVYFTGYYTPIVKGDHLPSKDYTYPLYGKPNKKEWFGKLPSRSQIDGEGALIGKGLELAYARSLADIYYMQLQGSGIVEYPNGQQEYLSFTSTNGHSYRSIEKHVVKNTSYKVKDISEEGMKRFFRERPDLEESILFTNPSYVFFDRKRKQPHGAGHVPLTAAISVAVDDAYIPLGSVLLAAVPVLNHKGRFTHHEYKILLAQDLGGAIRGSGHIDMYFGKGKKGRQNAMSMHHYGQLWLLLPKKKHETKGRVSMLNY